MPLRLLFAIHNHQPEGNFGEVFEESYEACYTRIVDALTAHPTVKVSLHHTGPLLEWIEQHRPGYFARVRRLVEAGQVELLGGGFYEPMLAILPERDAVGQIVMMADYLERHFGRRPEGMWLAERVWEPGLARVIAEAGMRFTLVDDTHFRAAGLQGPLRGYWVTEKAGHALAIFPIDKRLREVIPFSTLEETRQAFDELAAESGGEGAITYGDDGEKFGVWPKTGEWVWDKGWLEGFFRALEQSAVVSTRHFSDELARSRPQGRVYLPTASYEEMGEWTLPTSAQPSYLALRQSLADRGELDRARAFVRGGIWQGFLAKYDEANQMHKRMLAVSDRVDEALRRNGPGGDREGELSLARRELYRAQCNCAYWHGLFGGVYLNYLRDAVHRHLLVAEAFADGALGAPAPAWAQPRATTPEVVEETRDLDSDLRPEVALRTAALHVVVRPHDGGVVESIAYRPKTFLLTNVLSRREEGYHARLRAFLAKGGAEGGDGPVSIHDLVQVKEAGLDRFLVYDTRPRHSFVDSFVSPAATLDEIVDNRHRELGDFITGAYERRAAPAGTVALVREGLVDERRVRIDKTLRVDGARLSARWRIEHRFGAPLAVVFQPEIALTLLDGHAPDRGYEVPGRELPAEDRALGSRGELRQASALKLVNRANLFEVELRAPGRELDWWRFPLETVSNSESGFERTYQGSVLLPRFPLALQAGDHVELELELLCRDL
jgi:4-alpha-glucanotransferase